LVVPPATTDGDGLHCGEFAAEEEILVVLRDVKDSLVLTRNTREGGGGREGKILSLAFLATGDSSSCRGRINAIQILHRLGAT